MSKQTGNYLTVVDDLAEHSADGMRLFLADAGDSVEDTNFFAKTAEADLFRRLKFNSLGDELN